MKKILMMLLLLGLSFALRNPAAVYCEAMGYDYNLSTGDCEFLNDQSANAWEYLLGEAAQDLSYCAEEGHQMKIVNNTETCMVFLSETCAVCVLENGSGVEVTKLMKLSFEETTCGDGTCGFPEDYSACPEDCISGSLDGYCDGIADGICDSDCVEGGDIDCQELEEHVIAGEELIEVEFKPDAVLYVLLGLVGIVIIGAITYYVLNKQKK